MMSLMDIINDTAENTAVNRISRMYVG